MLEQNANRKAYYKFSEILRKATYKDVLELKKEALDKAMIKIAVGILPSKRYQRQYDPKYRNYLLGKLQDTRLLFTATLNLILELIVPYNR